MAVSDVERLVITLEARTKEYERALAKAQNTTVTAMRRIERDMQASAVRQQGVWATAGASITRTLGAIGAGITFARLTSGLATSITELANLADAAVEAGTSVEKLQAITSAGVEFGIKQEELVKGIARFNQMLGEAAEGSNELGEILAANNISVKDTAGGFRDSLDVLLDVADLIKNAGSAQERMVIATAALSREGKKYLPLLIGGREQLEASLIAAQELGNVIGTDVVESADRFVDAWDKFIFRTKTFIQADLGNLITALESIGAFGDTELSQRRDLVKLEQERHSLIQEILALSQEIQAAGEGDHFAGLNAERLKGLQEQLQGVYGNITRIAAALADAGKGAERGVGSTILPDNTEATKAVEKQKEAIDKLIASLNEELAVIQALGPVNQRMAGLRDTLGDEASKEAKEVRALVVAIEKEAAAKQKAAAVDDIVNTLKAELAVMRETDPVMKRMIELEEELAGASEERIAIIRRLITEQERLNRVAELGPIDQRTGLPIGGGGIDSRTGLTQADVARGVETGVGNMHEGVVGAIEFQTSALSRTFGEVGRHLTEGISSLISGPGSGQTFTSTAASPNFVAGLFEKELIANLEKQIEARQAEIAVLQTGLQYKNLTTEQTKEARLQIATLSLEIAQFSQGITTASQGIAQGTGFFADATTLFGDVLSQQIARAKQAGAALGSSLTAAEAARLSKINSFGGFAEGGVVRGPGGPKSDMVPIMASAGEFVVNAKQARKYRELLEAINAGSGRFMADGGLVARANASAQRLASGGVVQAAAVGPRWSGDINLGGVNIMAPEGRVSQASARDAGRQVAREVASHLREMGVM